MWALILACASFHSNPIISLNGFSDEASCKKAGINTTKAFSRKYNANNIYEGDCKFICVNQSSSTQ